MLGSWYNPRQTVDIRILSGSIQMHKFAAKLSEACSPSQRNGSLIYVVTRYERLQQTDY